MKLGLISDIHEDAVRLEQAVRRCEKHRCDDLACLGDITGYNPAFYPALKQRSARRCVELTRTHFRWVVPGNHDLFAAGIQPGHGILDEASGRILTAAEEDLALLPNGTWNYGGELPHDLDEPSREYLAGLPQGVILSLNGIRTLLSHYVYPDLCGLTPRYVKKRHDLLPLRNFMLKNNILLSVAGHTHAGGAGFAFPLRIKGLKRYLKAIHRMPFGTYPVGNAPLLCLLPALAADRGESGISILDTDNHTLDIIPLALNH